MLSWVDEIVIPGSVRLTNGDELTLSGCKVTIKTEKIDEGAEQILAYHRSKNMEKARKHLNKAPAWTMTWRSSAAGVHDLGIG